MPTVTFTRRGRPAVTFEADPSLSLLAATRRAGLPMASSCRGAGICDACRVRVTEGAANLSPLGEKETRAVLGENERLACQAYALGDVTVTTSYW